MSTLSLQDIRLLVGFFAQLRLASVCSAPHIGRNFYAENLTTALWHILLTYSLALLRIFTFLPAVLTLYFTSLKSYFRVLANNQLDALFNVFIYFISLHVSSITMLIIGRSNCINTRTSSGMISLVSECLVYRHTKQSLTRLILPNDVLIQSDLLMLSTVMLETCREMK